MHMTQQIVCTGHLTQFGSMQKLHNAENDIT